jgi:hypothetical protein
MAIGFYDFANYHVGHDQIRFASPDGILSASLLSTMLWLGILSAVHFIG